MKKAQKFFTVDNLKEKLKLAKGLFFTDYSGLKVDQINQLRSEIKKAGGEFEVVKNTLLRLAAKNFQFPISNFQLEGPTATLWIYNDDISPLKILDKFIKKNELPKIKFGFWDKEMIDNKKIIELANLPGLEELRAKLVGFLKSPFYHLTTDLNSNVLKLIYILERESKRVKE